MVLSQKLFESAFQKIYHTRVPGYSQRPMAHPAPSP